MKSPCVKTIFIALGFMLCVFSAQAQKVKAKALKPAEFKNLIEQISHPFIVDIRASEDYEAGHIPAAINLDATDFRFVQTVQNRCALSDTVFVYCKLGRTSKVASELLVKKGFLHIYQLKGGIFAWTKQYPLVSKD